MRFIVPIASALILAGCTTTPRPVAPAPAAPTPEPVQRGDLIGMSVDEIGARFGQPNFQVREGSGLKLQWSAPSCVLDAFIYPPASGAGVARVTFVDTRRPNGDPVNQADCIAALDAAG